MALRSEIRDDCKGSVAIIETDGVAMSRYAVDMKRKVSVPPRPARPINQWVRDALAHAGVAQAELARKLSARLRVSYDRSIVNKMTIGRDVSAEEMFAISELTGFETPNVVPEATTRVPLVSWVSAGDLQAVTVDEAPETIDEAGLPPGNWIALRVQGDSMDRISPPESIIFVNRADKRLVANACYVIDDGEGNATYKRYRPSPDRFEPVSTNKDLIPIFPEREPTIVGRVRKTILEM